MRTPRDTAAGNVRAHSRVASEGFLGTRITVSQNTGTRRRPGYVACLRLEGGFGSIGQHNIFVELLHDLNDEVQALHEGVDSDTQHAVRSRFVESTKNSVVQTRGVALGIGRGGRRGDDKVSAHQWGQFLVYFECLEGGAGEATRREWNVDSP